MKAYHETESRKGRRWAWALSLKRKIEADRQEGENRRGFNFLHRFQWVRGLLYIYGKNTYGLNLYRLNTHLI